MSCFEFCRQTVQQYEQGLYYVSLMAKGQDDRNALWAIFAFYHEVSKTRLVVSEPTLGLIRLQWWRDELDKLYSQSAYANNEILQSIGHLMKERQIDKNIWSAMIDAHDDELRLSEPPSSVAEAMRLIKALNVPLVQAVNDALSLSEEAKTIEIVAVNRGLADVLKRAQPDSIVRKAQDEFVSRFVAGVKTKSRIMSALQKQACLQFNQMKKADFDPYNKTFHFQPACEILRLWASLLLR